MLFLFPLCYASHTSSSSSWNYFDELALKTKEKSTAWYDVCSRDGERPWRARHGSKACSFSRYWESIEPEILQVYMKGCQDFFPTLSMKDRSKEMWRISVISFKLKPSSGCVLYITTCTQIPHSFRVQTWKENANAVMKFWVPQQFCTLPTMPFGYLLIVLHWPFIQSSPHLVSSNERDAAAL